MIRKRPRLLKPRRRKKPRFHGKPQPGSAPGTLRADPAAPAPVIRVMAYNAEQVVEKTIQNVAEIPALLEEFEVTWINVDGLGSIDTIRHFGRIFDLHPLAMEDVVHVHQRAKVEPYDQHLFIVARMVSLFEEEVEVNAPGGTLVPEAAIRSEQVSMFVGSNFVLTFQERPGDCLDPVRARLRRYGGMRSEGPDYLAYALIDAVVDSYFPVVDHFVDQLEKLEEVISTGAPPRINETIHNVRNDLLQIRRSIWPHRDSLQQLIRDESEFIQDATRIFLRDCYDHVVQLIDLLETYREMCKDLRDFYLATVSNRMNEVMKVLTIIATIFIPLSFLTGLYGMNFNTDQPGNMPELDWPYAYVGLLTFMTAVAVALLGYFRLKGWLGR